MYIQIFTDLVWKSKLRKSTNQVIALQIVAPAPIAATPVPPVSTPIIAPFAAILPQIALGLR